MTSRDDQPARMVVPLFVSALSIAGERCVANYVQEFAQCDPSRQSHLMLAILAEG
jgi:hypothetical protein